MMKNKRQWYYHRANKEFGPITEATIIELVEIGEVTSETMVRHTEHPDWSPAQNFEQLFASNNSRVLPPIVSSTNISSKTNYVMRHWRGELSLTLSYWINLFLLSIAVTIVILILSEQEKFPNPWYSLAFLLSTIVIYIWQIVGVWRSANRYVLEAQRKLPKQNGGWGKVAQFFAIIGVLNTVSTTLPVLQDTIALIAEGSITSNNFNIQLVGSTDIELNGEINQNSVNEVITLFEADSSRTALILNSPGGILVSAFTLADFVRRHDLIVGATEECVSACVFILASANTAVATTDASLVFHHPENIVDFRSVEYLQAAQEESREYYQRLEEYGVPAASLNEFKSNSFTALTLGEAYNASIITRIWEESTNTFHDPEVLCAVNDCFVTPVIISEALQAAQLSIFDVELGTCFSNPTSGDLLTIDPIACNTPHDYEVFGSFEIQENLVPPVADMNSNCLPLFEPYVGIAYLESTLEIDNFYPNSESFAAGERTVNCLVYDMNGNKLDRAARNGQF